MKSYRQIIKRFQKADPATLLLGSFMAAILVGAALLMLPISTVSREISFIDALFTSTSAVCVTGLIVVDTGSYFTLFGQVVILLLIQFGGLGIMTVSVVIFNLIGKRIPFRQRMVMQEVFSAEPREDIVPLLKSVLIFTGIAESVGAALLFSCWQSEFPPLQALYIAIFHSIAAFCNAGFSLFRSNLMDYRDSILINLTICALIIFGGIGFPLVYEIYRKTLRHDRGRLSVHTKAVLITTCALIFSGMAIFLLGERETLLPSYSLRESLLASFFQSVTCRTAGFNTVDIGTLRTPTLTFMIFLMFIGASPASTGGGVKTSTLFVLMAFSWSRWKRMIRVNMFKKSIPEEIVARSVSLVVLSVALISIILFLVLLCQPTTSACNPGKDPFLEYLFEVVSAFGTVGLSMGVTASLTTYGKYFIVLTMLIGRVGILAFSYAVAGREARNGFEYAEESLMVG